MDQLNRSSYRTFLTAVADAEIQRRSGLGLTLDAVIEDWREGYRDHRERVAADVREGRCGADADPAAGWDDLVIWEGNRVVAVLRPEPGSPELAVDRYDPAGAGSRC